MRHHWVLILDRNVPLGLVALAILLTSSHLVRPSVAWAHPLGNFTVNRYSRIEPGIDHVYLTYVIDLAEIPTFQEKLRIDLDRDGAISDLEGEAYRSIKVEEVRGGLHLSVNSVPVRLETVSQELDFPPGQAGLSTMRLSLLLAFSGGMALVLTGIGLLLVYTTRLVERISTRNPLLAWLNGIAPTAAGIVILLSGVVITAHSLVQVGLL